jgi:hypothetical protein
MYLLCEPFFRGFSVPVSVKKRYRGDASLEDIEQQERILLVNRTGALLPLTLNNQEIGENRSIDYEKITVARSLVD